MKKPWEERLFDSLTKQDRYKYFRSLTLWAKQNGVKPKAFAKKLGVSRSKLERMVK